MDLVIFCVATIICSGGLVSATPIRRSSSLPWTRPCEPDGPASGATTNFVTTTPIQMNENMDFLVVPTNKALEDATTLKNKIFQHRLENSQVRANSLDALKTQFISCDNMTWSRIEQTGEILRTHYRKLSTIYGLLDTIETNSRDNVRDQVIDLQGNILNILCRYSDILQSLDLSINHVTMNDIPVTTPTDRAMKNDRDYLIAKEAVSLLSVIRDNQSRMHVAYQ